MRSRDGRLVSESSSRATPTTSSTAAGNVFTRSWARISGRKRRPRPPPIEEGVELSETEPVASTSSQQFPFKLADLPPEKPKPLLNRGMDKLRRSIRKSFKKAPSLTGDAATSSAGTVDGDGIQGPWGLDEKTVRQGNCKFNVKYLGCCEVYESRGVHVCEGALQHLKSKKRVTKSILYISGDGLRVVDRESNRGLIVDQTIEKVSFCAPDRHFEKGFAYICREGATRRWMCHGFLTTKESGERVSHAVGCAFTICLEQKKKREVEQSRTTPNTAPATGATKTNDLNDVWKAPTPPPIESNGFAKNNLAYASFRRQLSIAERKQDPQTAILNEPVPNNSMRMATNEAAIIPRPHADHSLFDRQGSFKVPNGPQQAFKKFNSLRADLLSRPNLDSTRLLNTEPIYEGDEWPATSLSTTHHPLPVSTSLQFNHIAENKENGVNNLQFAGILNPTCQTTPVHSVRNTMQERSPSRADEWLEQTFKALSVRNDSPGSFASASSYANPPLPTSQSIELMSFSSPVEPLPSFPAAQSTVPPVTVSVKPPIFDDLDDVTDFQNVNKTHSRKGSSSKRVIEYQLLEEVDVPISPPRTTPAPVQTQELDAFGQPVFVPPTQRSGPSISDPFDVAWSTTVLKSSAPNGGDSRYALPPHNPFTSESASVNV